MRGLSQLRARIVEDGPGQRAAGCGVPDGGEGEGRVTRGGDAHQRIGGGKSVGAERGDGGLLIVLGPFGGAQKGHVAAGQDRHDEPVRNAEGGAAFHRVQQAEPAGGAGTRHRTAARRL